MRVVWIASLLVAATVLGSCSSGGVIGDWLPHWAGGYPRNAPPRPGTKEYEEFVQRLQANSVVPAVQGASPGRMSSSPIY